MIEEIKLWILEAGDNIRRSLSEEIIVSEKAGRTDLVTNIDKATQDFLAEKIVAFDPNAKILGEENGQNHTSIKEGRVFVIDPIDGTLNFVLEKEEFCIMLAVYEEGIGKLGFIYDVMRDELYYGGKGLGVFRNDQKLSQPDNLALKDGLIGMNAYLFSRNRHQARTIGEESMGIRVVGCAGLEMIAILKGTHNGYMSNLSPWDYAPGIILLEEFGFKFSAVNGLPLSFKEREIFIGGTPKTHERMLDLINPII